MAVHYHFELRPNFCVVKWVSNACYENQLWPALQQLVPPVPDQYVARGPLKEMADMLFTMPGRPTKVSLTGASTGLRKGIARSDLR